MEELATEAQRLREILESDLAKSRRLRARLLLAAGILAISGYAACDLGVQYEISQLPHEQRAGMRDFDWIGVRWVGWGGCAILLSLLLVVLTGFSKSNDRARIFDDKVR